jgi:pyruvate formate-lyase activating enzyme-like uncharacterized protein
MKKINITTKDINHNSPIPTLAGGWIKGVLPTGCQLCMKGLKMVFFMGGDCSHPPHCHWYCPISTNRQKVTSFYADEIQVKDTAKQDIIFKTLVSEIRKIGGMGMSFTGGDPLSSSTKCEMVVDFIKGMKAEFGDDFHIHLYTNGITFNAVLADQLEEAKLDEIRFHPAREDFDKLNLAVGRNYKVGAEVPVIPTEENHQYLLDLAHHLADIGADFLNLNEFEICEPNAEELKKRGFLRESQSLAAVEGSKTYAQKLIDELDPSLPIDIHFCTVGVKDGVQMRNRYIRRANNIKRELDEISDDGCLLFLRIEGPPSEIHEIHQILHEESGMPSHLLGLVDDKILDVPPGLADDEDFLDLLNQFQVKAGIYETTPFESTEAGYQICEYTPIQDKLPGFKKSRNRIK